MYKVYAIQINVNEKLFTWKQHWYTASWMWVKTKKTGLKKQTINVGV